MKTILCLLAFCSTMSIAQAQVFKSVSIKPLPSSEKGDVRMAGISPDGSYILTTSMSNKGLTRIDLATGQQCVLTTDEGAGFQPVVSPDGHQVLARSISFNDAHLRYSALNLLDARQATKQQLLAPSRELGGYGFRADEALAVSERGVSRRKIAQRQSVDSRPIAYIQDMQLMVQRDGQSVQLSPNGNDEATSYLWPSVSPDGQHIVYYVCDEGTYVCRTDGSDVQFISSHLLAPQWYDNETIVGMNTTDDGHFITSSSIVAYRLDGARQQLTDPKLSLMYPFCSATNGTIACSALTGEIVLINVSK